LTSKPVGWRKESQRHALAAKGISTGRHTERKKTSRPMFQARKPRVSWFDESAGEWRYRVRSPSKFTTDYGRKRIDDGVSLLLARNSTTKKWELQAIRFEKSKFSTAEKAKRWLNEHPNVIR